MIKKYILTVGISVGATLVSSLFATAQSLCAVDGAGLAILSAASPAVEAVQDEAAACGATTERDLEHRRKIIPALEANPADYNVVIGANATFTIANAAGLVASISEVAGVADVPDTMKIEHDSAVVALALMANAQHLMVRADLLEATGMEMPRTYEQVIALADKVAAMDLMQFPLTGTFASGLNLGQEFVNMWQGTGTPLFINGTEANIENAAGVATLEMMKALTERMDPDFLTFDTDAVQAQFEQGQAGIANLWGSRAATIRAGTQALGFETLMGSAPTFGGGDVPATTLWWEGFFFAANQSKEDLARAVALAIESTTADMLTKGNETEQTVWLIEGYEPPPFAAGVFASAANGAKPYPMLPHMGALHTALGAELVDYLSGHESAEQALEDVVTAYEAAMADPAP